VSGERASPVCFASEGSDEYVGYAGRDEILARLNELIEAERAGARVALDTLRSSDDPPLAALMRAVRRDESRWCAMLTREVRRLGGSPSRRCGAFHAKAMAIPDLRERISFLNRGQTWVARKLSELVPRVRDERLQDELRRMRTGHDENIAVAEAFLSRP
jgi:hypothetical protein